MLSIRRPGAARRAVLCCAAPAGLAQAAAPYHVGIVRHGEPERGRVRAAVSHDQGIRGREERGHDPAPDLPQHFNAEQETTISSWCPWPTIAHEGHHHEPAVPGHRGFRRIREMRARHQAAVRGALRGSLVIQQGRRPDHAHDFVSAGYRIIWASKQLAARPCAHLVPPAMTSSRSPAGG